MPFWITAENAASVLNLSERKLTPPEPTTPTDVPALAPQLSRKQSSRAEMAVIRQASKELDQELDSAKMELARLRSTLNSIETNSDAIAEPKPAASEGRSCAIERGTFGIERSSDAVRLRLEREHEERTAARSRRLKVESRVAGYQSKWANSTPSGRAFDSLPVVSDTTELDSVLRKNRAAFRSGVASAGRF